MKTTYTIIVTVLSILAIIVCPEPIKDYVMFGLLVMMISITRWESDKILKAIKANTSHGSKVLNIPRSCQTCKYHNYNSDTDKHTCSAHNDLMLSDALNASKCNKWEEF
jgi:hypothetical protein